MNGSPDRETDRPRQPGKYQERERTKAPTGAQCAEVVATCSLCIACLFRQSSSIQIELGALQAIVVQRASRISLRMGEHALADQCSAERHFEQVAGPIGVMN